MLDDGRALRADSVVLATGHPLPADPLARWLPSDAQRYVRDPWCTAALDGIGAEDSVLLLGTGLTMVDTALSLAARGHRGRIDALSRRGLLPRAHAPVVQLLPRDLHEELERGVARGNLRCALRAVRRAVAAAEARGLGWQCVIDALRSRTSALWDQLAAGDRRRFVERASSLLGRAPPPTASCHGRSYRRAARSGPAACAGRASAGRGIARTCHRSRAPSAAPGGWATRTVRVDRQLHRPVVRQTLEPRARAAASGARFADCGSARARLPDDGERHRIRDARSRAGAPPARACVPAAVVGAHSGARAAPASLRARRRASPPASRPCTSDSPSRARTVSGPRKGLRFRVFGVTDRSSA